MKERSNIFIVTGDFHQGKTTFARRAIELLKAKGHKVGGFLSIGTFMNGERDSFSLMNIETEKSIPLCSVEETQGWNKFRKFYFNPEAIKTGNQILKGSIAAEVICIDEIGPFELEGNGWGEGLEVLLNDSKSQQIWVIRNILTAEICEKYSIPQMNVFDINESSPQLFVERIRIQL